MADIQHSAISDPHIHEPKGATTASTGTVYVSDGSGSGDWVVLDESSLDWSSIQSEIQGDIDSGDLELNGVYYIHIVIPDISTSDSVIVPVIENATVVGARLVLGAAISGADATVSFSNSTAAAMGTPVTVAESGSAKGDAYTFTATGNNILTGPSWFEIATDGASSDPAALFITVQLASVLNP